MLLPDQLIWSPIFLWQNVLVESQANHARHRRGAGSARCRTEHYKDYSQPSKHESATKELPDDGGRQVQDHTLEQELH